jgi:hypothetical protein
VRLSFGHLLTGVLLVIWCAALSGLLLRYAPQTLLVMHLASAAGGVAPLALFLGRHWWSRREKIAHHPNTPQGYVALAGLALLTITGLALLRWTNVPALRWLHDAAMAVLLADLTVHMAWRLRKRWLSPEEQAGQPRPGQPRPRPSTRVQARATRRWVLGGLVAAFFVLVLAGVSQVSASHAQDVRVPIAHASLGTGQLLTAHDCSLCHSAITQQWSVSAHAHAATDAYYQAVTTLFMEERGAEAVRYCAACHNPVGLMQGEVDLQAAARTPSDGGAAYQARKLGINLPISSRAAEGVTCAMCHQATVASDEPGNGSLQLTTNAFVLPTNALAQLSLQSVPDAHKETLLRPVIQQAELCGSCHNLQLPNNGPALEPTYDEWKASPYPAQGRACQSCHLPQAQAAKSDSGLPQTVGAHGGIPGAPSSLPGMAEDTTLLKQAATLGVSLRIDPADPVVLVASVEVTNTGAGHRLPTGANDLRQMWLEVTLRDGTGRVLFASGTLDQYGALDPGTVQFHKVLGDAYGNPVELHRVWVATQVLTDTSLLPLETRRVPYRIALPPSSQGPFTLSVRLLYRDVSQAFAEFALNRAVQDLPTREMARTEVVMR